MSFIVCLLHSVVRDTLLNIKLKYHIHFQERNIRLVNLKK